jgi:hypothetical protein
LLRWCNIHDNPRPFSLFPTSPEICFGGSDSWRFLGCLQEDKTGHYIIRAHRRLQAIMRWVCLYTSRRERDLGMNWGENWVAGCYRFWLYINEQGDWTPGI